MDVHLALASLGLGAEKRYTQQAVAETRRYASIECRSARPYMNDRIPKPHELPKKPLVEAVFELRWRLQKRESGEEVDPGFQFLLGKFYDQISDDFPEVENLPAASVPEHMVPSVVRHRFRKLKDGWPLIQIGPGVLSVNDTASYTWSSFQPMLEKAVDVLLKVYPTKIWPLSFVQATLRYIDAVAIEPHDAEGGVLSFLKTHLHTEVSVDPLLFKTDAVASQEPGGLQLRLNYPLQKPRGMGVLLFTTGQKDGVPSIIWETLIVSREAHVPNALADFSTWFREAHEITDSWFFALCRGKLLDSFGGNNDHD